MLVMHVLYRFCVHVAFALLASPTYSRVREEIYSNKGNYNQAFPEFTSGMVYL